MNKWKQRLSVVIAVIFTSITLLGNVPAQAAGMKSVPSKKTMTTSQRVSKDKKISSNTKKNIKKGGKTQTVKKSNTKKGVALKNKKPQKTNKIVKKKATPKKTNAKGKTSKDADDVKAKKEIVLITKGVIRGGKSINTPQNISTNVRMNASDVIYNNVNISGDLYISANNCKLNNIKVAGTIFVNPGEKGSANLEKVTCQEMKVLSGDKNSIHLKDVKVQKNLIVNSKNEKEIVRVEISGETAITETLVNSSAMLDVVKGSFGNITIADEKLEVQPKEVGKLDSKDINGIQSKANKEEIKKSSDIKTTAQNNEKDKIIELNSKSIKGIQSKDNKEETKKSVAIKTTTQDNKKNKIIELKGIFNKNIIIQNQAIIKTSKGAVIPEIKISSDKKDENVILDGIFKNITIDKESKVQVAANSQIEKLVINAKVDIKIDNTAKILKTEDKNKNANITNATVSTGTSAGTTKSEQEDPDEVTVNLRIEGYNHTVVPYGKVKVKVFNLQPYLGKASGTSATESKGWDVDKFKRPTAAHAVVRALKDNGIKFDFQDYGWSCYIAMVDGDREFDQGPMSGWMYRVDGVLPSRGLNAYDLKGGENITLYYGAFGFDNIYTNIDTDKDKVKVGQSVKVFVTGDKVDIENATILVNGSPTSIVTNKKGEASITFDKAGKYEISATREKETKKGPKIDIVRPIPSIVTVEKGDSSSTPSTPTTDNELKITTDLMDKEVTTPELTFTASAKDAKNAEVVPSVKIGNVVLTPVDGKYKTILSQGENIITIEASNKDGKKVTKIIKITCKHVQVTGINIEKQDAQLGLGETYQLIGKILPQDASNKNIKWISSNEKVATVDATGKITGVSDGTAVITAVTEDGKYKTTCNVKVVKNIATNEGLLNEVNSSLNETAKYYEKYFKDNSGLTAWPIIGLAKYYEDINNKPCFKIFLSNVEKELSTLDKDGFKKNYSKVTDIEKLLMAVSACKGDTNNLKYNLVDEICNYKDITRQGLNASIYGLIALDSKEYKEPLGAKYDRSFMLDYIIDNQNSDGGWDLTCNGTKSDVDITAMTLISLAPHHDYVSKSGKKVSEIVSQGVEWLSKNQQPNAGFNSWGTENNSESCAQVIIALCANRIDPTGAKFTKNGTSLVKNILKFKGSNGMFKHVLNAEDNGMATEQAFQALIAYRDFTQGKGSIYNYGKQENSTNPTEPTYSEVKLTDLKPTGDTALSMTKEFTGNIKIGFNNSKVQEAQVTITIFKGDELKYIEQIALKNGIAELNTRLDAGKYHGFYKTKDGNKVEIPEFEIK